MTVAMQGLTLRTSRTVTAGSAFAVAWAGANIIHLLNQTHGDLQLPAGWLNIAAALWVLCRPSSAHRLALLAAAQVVDTVWELPYPPDHQLLATVVNLAVLIAYLTQRRPATVDTLLGGCAPTGRVLVLLAYLGAATAKYNTDFLSVESSCANFMAHTASFGMLERTGTVAPLVILGTIGSETLIPILLMVPRTRRWGVCFAIGFHYLLSLSPAIGVGDFSVTLWALYLLFLPTQDVEAVGRRMVAPWCRSRFVVGLERVPGWAVVAIALALILVGSVGSGVAIMLFVWLATTIVGGLLLVTLVRVLRTSPHDVRRMGRPGRGLQALPIVLMLALVASPYLGFGTSSRFTMFSGLRTEGPGTNHLFLPSIHLIDSQNDSLVVLEANGVSSTLERAAKHDAAMPVVQVRQILQDPEVSATFRTPDGKVVVVAPGDDGALRAAPTWWEAKTQHYRPFKVAGTTDEEFCSN